VFYQYIILAKQFLDEELMYSNDADEWDDCYDDDYDLFNDSSSAQRHLIMSVSTIHYLLTFI